MLEKCKSIKQCLELEWELSTSEKPVAAIFFAAWSTDCRDAAPALDHVLEKFQEVVHFTAVDIDCCPLLEDQYHVEAVPTVVIFRSGKEVCRLVNEKDAARYAAAIESLHTTSH